jgi:penicillin-binding protein 2
MRSDSPRLRLGVLGVVAVSLFAALFARLWYLQVLASPDYQTQAAALQQRVVTEPAPRGRILDRNGVVLVDNRLSYVVTLDRELLAELDEAARADLFARLVQELQATEPELTVEILEQRLSSERYSPYTPVPVAHDIPEQLAVYLTEHEDEFGGIVQVDARAIREYPFGRLASHLLGYVGAINDEEFERLRDSPENYQLTDEIGKAGVERTYESELRGKPGRLVLEVDANGRTIRQLDYEPPVPGHDVVLSIDAQVQAVAEQALREEIARTRQREVSAGNAPNRAPAGSVVVLDPRDGSVVAMASFPDYDPRAFVDGIDNAEWAALNSEESHYPLLNRTIQGEYAPGSTFKLITAYAGLASGLITTETVWHDEGEYIIPNCSGPSCDVQNAGETAYGSIRLPEALTVSSDTYFYDIGARAWFQREQVGDPIQDAARLFGMGSETGIPLPNEHAGRVMTPEQYAQRHEENPEAFPDGVWQAGDNVNIAIGQGEMLATPLQLANAYAALANGGTLYSPTVATEVRRARADDVVKTYEPQVLRTIPFEPAWWQALVDGFRGVTSSGDPRGTAYGTFRDFPNWGIAGKTGTAEVGTASDPRADTAVFVAWTPVEQPRYVAAAFLEESGFGGVAAAPLVRRILEPLALGELPDVVKADNPYGYTVALAEQANPFSEGDVID